MRSLYPSLTDQHIKNIENALCPAKVPLKKDLQTKINKICVEFLDAKKEVYQDWDDSVLNCLDFHFYNDQLKIIESNTNASGYLISNLSLENEAEALFFEKQLVSSFKFTFLPSNLDHIYIIDKDPEAEKMYPEFLMFKDMFKRHQIKCDIIKTEELSLDQKSLVYNRDTDFYLENSPELLKAWESTQIKLSTSPKTYKTIASKKTPFLTKDQLNSENYPNLADAMLKSFKLTQENKDDVWLQRKQLFFKPAESFGSKGVYAGKSISRKKFETLDEGYIAQELHPPSQVIINETPWKYDIRAFFSEGEVQKVVARVYQGQLTNFANPGGGFALVEWV